MDYNVTFRNKNGSVQAVISYKDGDKWKQKSKQGFKTQKAAKPWISDTVEKIGEDLKFDYSKEELIFDELFTAYTKHADLYKAPNTLKNYTSAYNYFDKIKNIEVKKIDILILQECVDEMVKLGLNSETIRSYVAKIRIVFDYAIKPLKLIRNNPLSDIVMPKKNKEQKKEVKALTKKELDHLLSKITYQKHYLVSLVAATTGLRIGEILGLTWDNIDEKKSILKVEKQWKIVNSNPITFSFGALKSKNSYRDIPIPPKTLIALKQYKKDKPIHISNRVFPLARTDSFASTLNTLYKSLGYDISIHGLRHTYASMLVASGMDFKSVAQLMGHTVQETIETYSHFTSDMMERAQKAVNNIF